jgi:hypothetical protein
MIPKSLTYKLVLKSTGFVIAEGSKKEMEKLQKQTPNTRIWISKPTSTLGQYLGKG